MKAIMKNLGLVDYHTAFMHCPICNAEYSANPSDYFMVNDPNHKFYCCHRVMELVVKRTVYEEAQS